MIILPDGDREKAPEKTKVYWCPSSIYGLKQSDKIWNKNIIKHLTTTGFNECVYFLSVLDEEFNNGDRMKLLSYVDDMIYASSRRETLDEFEKELRKD